MIYSTINQKVDSNGWQTLISNISRSVSSIDIARKALDTNTLAPEHLFLIFTHLFKSQAEVHLYVFWLDGTLTLQCATKLFFASKLGL